MSFLKELFAMKSTKAYLLIIGIGWYRFPYSLNSNAHFTRSKRSLELRPSFPLLNILSQHHGEFDCNSRLSIVHRFLS